MAASWKIEICGIVQGVGFRPFLHRLARIHGLGGRVWNDGEGVTLIISAEAPLVDAFVTDIKENAPFLAHIESVSVSPCEAEYYSDFKILPSVKGSTLHARVSPDVGICGDCLRELFDKNDRRYRYPFINCTNCGPRFTIVRDIPYDRANTTMAKFPMCAECADEYGDIETRRYHAQPDCCAKCGPRVFYLDADGNEEEGDAIENAQKALKNGKIVAVKGLGGIHLACDAKNEESVKELRKRKRRDERPFALLCRDMDAVRALCRVDEASARFLQSEKRPIVLLEKRDGRELSAVSENRELGVMLPYTPLHYLLMDGAPGTLVLTSANLSEKPIIYTNEAAKRELHGIADGFLLHNRDIFVPCDDSLIRVVGEKPYPIRRSRGFVPEAIKLSRDMSNILACGAEQKASFAISKENDAFLSQHIGDLKNFETLELYENMCAHFARLFDCKTDTLACDMHPDYLSTGYARERAQREGLRLIQVQHHHAHMASCMEDNRLEDECIGVIWDGTGYGTDGTTWGGEFLTGDYKNFCRAGHIRALPLIGGDAAIKEISRVGCALSVEAEAGGFGAIDEVSARSFENILNTGLNCPLSSGMGRLFDGVYSLVTGRSRVSYEGQAATLLEAEAENKNVETEVYPSRMDSEDGMWIWDWRPMIRAILKDKAAGTDKGRIFARFEETLSQAALEACENIRKDSGLTRVVLSGGVFLNMTLLSRISELLEKADFEVYKHSRVSTGDEGISFGQLAVAAAQRDMEREKQCV